MKLSVLVGLVGVASATSHLNLHLHVGKQQGVNDWMPAGPDDGKPLPLSISLSSYRLVSSIRKRTDAHAHSPQPVPYAQHPRQPRLPPPRWPGHLPGRVDQRPRQCSELRPSGRQGPLRQCHPLQHLQGSRGVRSVRIPAPNTIWHTDQTATK